jgi:hypothetical protein
MPSNYPKDRFDNLPRKIDRVGAHRPPARRGRRWIAFWWALAATVLLITIGVVGLFILDHRLDLALPGNTQAPATSAPAATPTPTPTPTSTPTPEPTLDPDAGVTVLNGSEGFGVAGAVSDTLGSAGWTITSTGDADSEEIPSTTVYYSDPALEGAARGVLDAIHDTIPMATLSLSDDYADSDADITVVVGNDYPPLAQ